MTIFVNFFEKKYQVFGNFLTFKCQISGGSGVDLELLETGDKVSLDVSVRSRQELERQMVEMSERVCLHDVHGTRGQRGGVLHKLQDKSVKTTFTPGSTTSFLFQQLSVFNE